MFEIRFYYKNEDEKVKRNVVWHTYSYYKTFENAYIDFIELMNFYNEIKVEEVVFNPSFPKEKLESFVLFLANKNKELVTIVSS